ncbi:hypothetical protein AB837_00208 [bacterium AB1]|nr:hypothetical protein AB837_00208 [bacterium AB1]
MNKQPITSVEIGYHNMYGEHEINQDNITKKNQKTMDSKEQSNENLKENKDKTKLQNQKKQNSITVFFQNYYIQIICLVVIFTLSILLHLFFYIKNKYYASENYNKKNSIIYLPTK